MSETLLFRNITDADLELAEEMKRATVRDAMGDDSLFDTWFTRDKPFDAHLKRLIIFDSDSCVFALVGNTIVGHLHLMIVEDGACGYLNDIYLKPEWRGRGLGDQLDAYATRFFKKHHVDRAKLRTNPTKPKLIEFYERMGWELGEPSVLGLIWMHKQL